LVAAREQAAHAETEPGERVARASLAHTEVGDYFTVKFILNKGRWRCRRRPSRWFCTTLLSIPLCVVHCVCKQICSGIK
jgi:hypothetical protein